MLMWTVNAHIKYILQSTTTAIISKKTYIIIGRSGINFILLLFIPQNGPKQQTGHCHHHHDKDSILMVYNLYRMGSANM